MHRLNSEAFHVDLMRSTEILARIETVDAISYSEEDDEGDFACTVVIRGSVEMRPSGVSLSDAVGVVLGALLDHEIEDVDGMDVTFEPAYDFEEEEGEEE